MSPLPQSKATSVQCNFNNKLRSFSGLKAATAFSCEPESAFSGKDSRAALQASFACKAQNQSQRYLVNNQIDQTYSVYPVYVIYIYIYLKWCRYVKGQHPVGADQIDFAKTKLASKAREMKEKAEQQISSQTS